MNTSRFLWGFTYILLGLLWFATALGYLSDSVVWARILTLWPLLIVIVGLNLVVRNRMVMSGLGLVLLLVAFVYVAYSPKSFGEIVGSVGNTVQSSETSIDPAEKTLELTVNTGAISLDIHAMSDEQSAKSDLFVEERNMSSFPNIERTIDKESVKVVISESDNNSDSGQFILSSPSRIPNRSMKLLISKKIKLKVTLNTGASKEKIDLSHLQLTDLTIKSGAVNSDIKLGDFTGTHRVDIQSGASDYNILIPKNNGFKVSTNSGLTNIHYPTGSELVNGNTEKKSENYDTANSVYDIGLKSGLTSLNIKTY